jgi:four helix bundle protein
MTETQKTKKFDLAERTQSFSEQVIKYINQLPKNITNMEISKQLVRSAGSIGANYIEAEDALSKKDFILHIKISRKEAKETRYWLKLSNPNDIQLKEKDVLLIEATELMKIFGAIVTKSQ